MIADEAAAVAAKAAADSTVAVDSIAAAVVVTLATDWPIGPDWQPVAELGAGPAAVAVVVAVERPGSARAAVAVEEAVFAGWPGEKH